MEAVGIEPTSEKSVDEASTCVSLYFKFRKQRLGSEQPTLSLALLSIWPL